MLFKKLLKLLSGIAAGLFLFLNSSYSVMANVVKDTTISSILPKVLEINTKRGGTKDPNDELIEITNNTTEDEFIKAINSSSYINISGQVKLTKNVIEAIETKIEGGNILELAIVDQGILLLGDDSTNINVTGNHDYGLSLIRGGSKTGALLRVDTVNPINIAGVKFENATIDEPVVDIGTNTQVSFTSNNFANGLLDLTGIESGIAIDIDSRIYGQDYVKLSAKVKSAIKFNDLKITFGVSNISASHIESSESETSKYGDNVFESSEVKVEDLKPGHSYFLSIILEDSDSQKNIYTISDTSSIEDIVYTSQFNSFNLERSKLGSDSVTFDVFLGTNGNDKNGRKQYPLTLEVKDNSGNFKETITVEGKEAERKSYTINKLSPNTTYTCTLIDGLGNELSKETFTTLSSNSSTPSTDGSGSVSSNNTVVLSITSYDINRSDISDVDISIPISNETLLDSFKTGKDFSVNVKGLKISFDGSRIKLEGLVPNKEYKNLTITYTDNKGVKRTVNINNFASKYPFNSLREFILQVYTSSMDRDADEEGFTYWNKKLEDKSVTPQSFVLNLLAEDEFKEIYKTIESRIEGLYKVIVNREADKEGLEFWTNRYKDILSQENNESSALLEIANEMVNEKEFIERCEQLFKQDSDDSQV